MTERREGFGQRRVKVTPEFIRAAIAKQNPRIKNDTRLLRIDYEPEYGEYVVTFESDRWEHGDREGEYIRGVWEDE